MQSSNTQLLNWLVKTGLVAHEMAREFAGGIAGELYAERVVRYRHLRIPNPEAKAALKMAVLEMVAHEERCAQGPYEADELARRTEDIHRMVQKAERTALIGVAVCQLLPEEDAGEFDGMYEKCLAHLIAQAKKHGVAFDAGKWGSIYRGMSRSVVREAALRSEQKANRKGFARLLGAN